MQKNIKVSSGRLGSVMPGLLDVEVSGTAIEGRRFILIEGLYFSLELLSLLLIDSFKILINYLF